MKKYCIYTAAVSMLALAACSSDNDQEIIDNSPKTITLAIEASTQPSTETRAEVKPGNNFTDGSGSVTVLWQSTDHLAVYGNSGTLSDLTYDGATGTENIARFSANNVPVSDAYYCLSPYSAAAGISTSSHKISAVIPANQTATINSFDPTACVMSATTAGQHDTSVDFKHICCYFSIVTTSPSKSITITAYTGTEGNYTEKNIAGTTTIEAGTIDKNLEFTSNTGNSTVTLSAPNNGTFAEGAYLIAMAPSTDLTKLIVKVTPAEGEIRTCTVQKTDKSVFQFAPGRFYRLGTVGTNNPTTGQ